MSTSSLRVVLDSNVFSSSHFDGLKSSRFHALCKQRRIVALYPAEMIEETLRSYLAPATRLPLVNEWLPFILATGERLCDDLQSVWRKELVQGKGLKAHPYIGSTGHDNLIQSLLSLPEDGSSDLVAAAKDEWNLGVHRRHLRRQHSKRMRQEISVAARRLGVKYERALVPPAVETAELSEFIAAGVLQKFVSPGNWRALLKKWRAEKHRYPFFTQFVDNAVYQETLFVTDPTMKIDLNAQLDLDILTHLLHADIIVTNEKGFMMRAFDDVWKHRGKVLMNSVEFTRHLDCL